MPYLLRCWLGTAAVGAGLVHLGVASRAPVGLLALLAVIGAAEIVWGVAALARSTVPAPRLSLGGVLVPIAVQVVALLLAGGGHDMHLSAATGSATPAFDASSLLGASLLDLVVAAGLAVVLRRQGARPGAEPGALVMLLGVGLGSGLVALVVVNSLAAVMPGGMVH